MSPANHDSPERARGRMARRLFVFILCAGLLPLALFAGLVYTYLGPQVQTLPLLAQRIGLGLLLLVAGLLALAAWLESRRWGSPMHDLVGVMRRFVEGNWEQRANPTAPSEVGDLGRLFNEMADELREVYNMLSIRDAQDAGSGKPQSLALMGQIIEAAPNLGELYRGALEMIARYYACQFAALYLVERSEPGGAQYVTLVQSAGTVETLPAGLAARFSEARINLDQTPTMDWLVGKAIASRRSQSGAPLAETGLFEAVLPVLRRMPDGSQRLLGAIDLYTTSKVKDNRLGPFSVRALGELQNLANLLGMALTCMTPGAADAATAALPRPAAPAGSPPALTLPAPAGGSAEALYATTRLVAQAETAAQVLEAAVAALQGAPFVSALLVQPEGAGGAAGLQLIEGRREPPASPAGALAGPPPLLLLLVEEYFRARQWAPVSIDDLGRAVQEADSRAEKIFTGVDPSGVTAPLELLQTAQYLGAESAAFVPSVSQAEGSGPLRMLGVLVLGRPPRPALRGMQTPPLSPAILEPYVNLLNLVTTALERVRQQVGANRRLAELETIWQISQTIAAETDMAAFYPALHQQVLTVMGELSSFAILLYDEPGNNIQVPYMIEEGHRLLIDTFHMAEKSLTAHVIRSREPLLLRSRQEVEEMSAQIGSKQVGQAAHSWLGAPMVFAGQVLGVIIVQDIRQEQRFSYDDQRLLATLANQAAVVVRNARLLEITRAQVEQEQAINEITASIRRAVDIEGILKTTAEALGRTLGAQRTAIRIGGPENVPPSAEPPPGSGAPDEGPPDGSTWDAAPAREAEA
ncbi:MAG: GAF domain-containing protein [Chloroflexota bacterium]